jgi:hypothetical protein
VTQREGKYSCYESAFHYKSIDIEQEVNKWQRSDEYPSWSCKLPDVDDITMRQFDPFGVSSLCVILPETLTLRTSAPSVNRRLKIFISAQQCELAIR